MDWSPPCDADYDAILRTMPSLKPEPADTNELPRIAGYDLESPPQGTSRELQVIRSFGRTLTIQACAQLRCHVYRTFGQGRPKAA
jgi:hypothetical protein